MPVCFELMNRILYGFDLPRNLISFWLLLHECLELGLESLYVPFKLVVLAVLYESGRVFFDGELIDGFM